jgi:hypothetical protein
MNTESVESIVIDTAVNSNLTHVTTQDVYYGSFTLSSTLGSAKSQRRCCHQMQGDSCCHSNCNRMSLKEGILCGGVFPRKNDKP